MFQVTSKTYFFIRFGAKCQWVKKSFGDINGFKSVQWRIHIVKFWTPPPSGSKFFQLHAVFGEIWQNRMLVPRPRRVGAPTPRKSWIRHHRLELTWGAILSEQRRTLRLGTADLLIWSTGGIFWITHKVFKSACLFDVTDYHV